MSEEKPLHVQVAEALGEVRAVHAEQYEVGQGMLCPRCDWLEPWNFFGDTPYCIPRYDTDWSATGPLIERYGISLHYALSERHEHRFEWIASENVSACRCVGRHAWNKLPLIAACRLLVEALPNGMHECSRAVLKAAGKL